MCTAGPWASELRAHIAVQDYDSALDLAARTILSEDRFHLLTLIARGKKERGLTPDPRRSLDRHSRFDEIDGPDCIPHAPRDPRWVHPHLGELLLPRRVGY